MRTILLFFTLLKFKMEKPTYISFSSNIFFIWTAIKPLEIEIESYGLKKSPFSEKKVLKRLTLKANFLC